jgi:transaldolase
VQGFNLGAQEIQLQAWGNSAGKLYSTALDLAAIDPRIVVKVPVTHEGIEAANLLKANNVRVTLTGMCTCPTLTALYPGGSCK